LGFGDPLDLDRHRFHGLLDPFEAIRNVRGDGWSHWRSVDEPSRERPNDRNPKRNHGDGHEE